MYFQLFFNYISIIFQLFFNSLSILYQFFINSLSILYQFFFNSLSIIFQFFINSFSILYQLFFNSLSILYQFFFNSLSIIFQLLINYLSILYQLLFISFSWIYQDVIGQKSDFNGNAVTLIVFSVFQSHLEVCPFNRVPCPNLCSSRPILRKSASHHLLSSCVKRAKPCQHCGEMFSHQNIEVRAWRCAGLNPSCFHSFLKKKYDKNQKTAL